MRGPYRKSLDDPGETFELQGMVEHLVAIGDYTVGKVVQPPGFRWSTHVQPIVGGEWCQARHALRRLRRPCAGNNEGTTRRRVLEDEGRGLRHGRV